MRTLAEAAEYVMQVVCGLGFDPTESSRFAKMRNLFSRKGFVPEQDPDFEVACEALRDITLLEYAFDQLLGRCPDHDLRDKVRLVVKDSVLPQDDRGSTPGRDAQSELHVAAVCMAAGLDPRFAEPDVVVDLGGRTYGLAVKRFKNLKRLQEHFEKAVSQIERSGIPGFVVLDMVLAANPENARLSFLVRDQDFLGFQRQRFNPFLKQHQDKFRAWRKGREVRGVLVLDQIVCPVDDQRHWGLRGFTTFGDLDPHNQCRRREALAFWEVFKMGVFNPAF